MILDIGDSARMAPWGVKLQGARFNTPCVGILDQHRISGRLVHLAEDRGPFNLSYLYENAEHSIVFD